MRLFDLHCDTLYECYHRGQSLCDNSLHVDLRRASVFERYAQVFAVWMPDSLRGEAAVQECGRILDFAVDQLRQNTDRIAIYREGRSLHDIWNSGRAAAILAVEGGSALGGDLWQIEKLAQRDVKILTLTWNGENELGYGAGCDKNLPLKPFGRAAVRELERQGILPDVSHLNERGFWDVCELAEGAVIASHSLSAAVHVHPRNLSDGQFLEICRRGGLCGLNLAGSQLGEQTFACVERHLDHYLSLGGEHAVAFGCDLDGTDLPPEWGGIEVMPRLYDYLCRKNYEEALLCRLFFSNCSDFFSAL